MPEQSINQKNFPLEQGTAQCVLLPSAYCLDRAIEHIELFPAPQLRIFWSIQSGLSLTPGRRGIPPPIMP